MFPSPIVGASGHLDDKTIYVMRGKKCFRRKKVPLPAPESERQLTHQQRWGMAQSNWKNLSAAERDGWHVYALSHAFNHRPFKLEGNAGQNAYTHAQCNRLAWGETSLSTAPPTLPCPPLPLAVEEVPGPGPSLFALRIRHSVEAPDGYQVLFEMTPATDSLRRKPEERRYVYAGETSADSFLPLGPDGAVYLLDHTRYTVEPGRRYGVRISLLTPDGMAGPKLTRDFIRLEPIPGSI